MSLLRDQKTALLTVNLNVHAFVTETGIDGSQLKNNISQLYKLWDDVYQR